MKEIIFIKYGGSIITDKSSPLSVSKKNISMLNEQVKSLSTQTSYLIIIGNGGGAFGHYFAEKYQLYNEKISEETLFGICNGKNGTNYLNRIIVEDLLSKKIPACSVRISVPYILQNNVGSWDEVFLYLDNNITPVIYGDILFLSNMKYKIISTEQAFMDLAKYLNTYKKDEYRINKFIFCTNTDGVLDKNGLKISKLSVDFKDSSIFWNNSNNYDVTGGMREKVQKSLELSYIAPVQIINGGQEDCIIKAVKGKDIGTLIEV